MIVIFKKNRNRVCMLIKKNFDLFNFSVSLECCLKVHFGDIGRNTFYTNIKILLFGFIIELLLSERMI